MDGMPRRFQDRRDAGRLLAAKLSRYKDFAPVVLALPRGGVPVGYEVAKALEAPLDLLLVRKIGAPMHPELGIGAVVDGINPQLVLNERLIRHLGIGDDYIRAEERRQLVEIERRRTLYRGGRAALEITGRTVILVDDGIATGATVKAGLLGLARSRPARLILAVPVAAAESLEELAPSADEVVCLYAPAHFRAVGEHYVDFSQTSDEEVIDLLSQSRHNPRQAAESRRQTKS